MEDEVNCLFCCPFCRSGTRPIPHTKGEQLVIAKCDNCRDGGIVLFFTYNRLKKIWKFKNFEIPNDEKK